MFEAYHLFYFHFCCTQYYKYTVKIQILYQPRKPQLGYHIDVLPTTGTPISVKNDGLSQE